MFDLTVYKVVLGHALIDTHYIYWGKIYDHGTNHTDSLIQPNNFDRILKKCNHNYIYFCLFKDSKVPKQSYNSHYMHFKSYLFSHFSCLGQIFADVFYGGGGLSGL